MVRESFFFVLAFAAMAGCSPRQGAEIRAKGDGFELRVDGKLTYIKGIGGTNRPDIAAENGANACRTWGGDAESIRRTAALAAEHGMYVMQGIWLPKEAEKYSDEKFKDEMRAFCRATAEEFKNDPNILVWGIGNEVELSGTNNAAVWGFIDELSRIMKSVDGRHLTSTVIAHNRSALDSIARYAPSLDVVGINSYGPILQVKDMVAASDYKGPYMITEWGPTGWWETYATEWKAPIEQTSEQKRQVYETRYNEAILGDPRCIGSFVFLWGQKEERTPTWFSMFVENGVVKTFSRGGSDITGSIVARAVKAEVYENWTDVSGVLVADPRIIENPEAIDTITYRELRELSYMGFNVLHEDAIFPVRREGIPINIRNTNKPGDQGTWIVESTCQKSKYVITGIAGKKGFCSVNIEKAMMNSEIGFGRKVLQAFEDYGISFEHVPSGIDTMTVFVHQDEFMDKEQKVVSAIHRLARPDSVDIEGDLALIAVVGRGMRSTRGTAGRIFSALAHANVNVKMIDQGSSELNIIIGVADEDFEAAIAAIYDIFVVAQL